MARRVLVTRPAAEATELAAELARRGVEAVIAPMLSIVPTGARIPDAGRFQAAAVTSGNGADGLAAATSRRALPVFAVGDATAGALRRHGFAPVIAAEGTGTALVDLICREVRPQDGPLLWASGDEVRVDLAAELGLRGHAVERIVVYRAEAVAELPEAASRALADGSADGVLFFSPRSADRFASLVVGAGLARQAAGMTAYCLSAAVAEAARRLPWAAIRIAGRPTRDDLLATLDDTTSSDPD
ncbi:MAG: uroporphyrinogen-III synthase [Thalassobaculum sp.]|uniref:uroporphyrinogen-III synthase n=1 Tax=Thalassobaculum sp. TaxID=2022740 RepID=UPI0032EFAF99